MPRYHIPKKRHRVEIKAGNSRFIATIAPAATIKDAQAFLNDIRSEMPDASHHVYAFRIGYGNSVTEAMSDDGEPSGTSGPPALAVVRGSGLGDVALVITRYFGGTKLGTGGLVAAYTAAAQAAFAELETEEKVARTRCTLTIPYALLERVRLIFADFEATIENESFASDITLTFDVPEENLPQLTQAIRDMTAGQSTPIPV